MSTSITRQPRGGKPLPNQVNILDAKTNFSKLVARAEKGEEILISRNGVVVAKLVSSIEERNSIKLGSAKAFFANWDLDNLDAFDEAINATFHLKQ